MRASYYEFLDTLKKESVPKDGQPEINYQPRGMEPSKAILYSVFVLALGSFLGLAFVACLRIFANSIQQTFFFTLVSVAGLFLGFFSFLSREHVALCLGLAASGIFLWFFLTFLALPITPVSIYLVSFTLALVLTTLVADQLIAPHYLQWLLAEPRFDRTTAARLMDIWHQRWKDLEYWSNLCLLAFVFLAGLVLLAPLSSVGRFRLFFSSVVGLLITAFFAGAATYAAIRGYGRPAAWQNLRPRLALFWEAFSRWLTYAPHPFAPGVLRTTPPFTSPLSRLTVAFFCLSFIVAGIVPSGSYFPLTSVYLPPWEDTIEVPKNPEAQLPSLNETEINLNPIQRNHLQRLTPAEQTAYLQALVQSRQTSTGHPMALQARAQFYTELNSSPEAWLPKAASGLLAHPRYFLITFTVSFFISIVVTGTVFLSICTVVLTSSPVLSVRAEAQRILDDPKNAISEWDGYVTRVQNSHDAIERDSLFLGIHDAGNYPVLLPQSILRQHAHILGDSGSGKTALGLMPLITQLIRMSGRKARERNSTPLENPPCSILVIDLKGDKSSFYGCKIEAERAEIPFKWFTTSLNCSTYMFNPFLQRHFQNASPAQRNDLILSSLGLIHGEGYGRSYFSRVNRSVLGRIMEVFGDGIHSFRHLRSYTERNDKYDSVGKSLRLSPKQREDATELFATVSLLAACPAINITADDNTFSPEERDAAITNQIDMFDLFREPQVLYFSLSSGEEESTVREIAKLALYSLLTAAIFHKNHAQEPSLQVYLFIDEFQQIVSSNLEIILRQARSMGIGAILANHTIDDLLKPGSNLISTVRTNTCFKQFFSVGELRQQDDLIKSSGETVEHVYSWYEELATEHYVQTPFDNDQVDQREPVVHATEKVGPRLNRNDILTISADKNLSIVQIRANEGYAQYRNFPFPLRSDFHISKAEYTRRDSLPWPEPEPGTVTVKQGHFKEPAAFDDILPKEKPGVEEDTLLPSTPAVEPGIAELLQKRNKRQAAEKQHAKKTIKKPKKKEPD